MSYILDQRGVRGGRKYLIKLDETKAWMRRSQIEDDVFDEWSCESNEAYDHTPIPVKSSGVCKKRRRDVLVEKKDPYRISNRLFKQQRNLTLIKSVYDHLGGTRSFDNYALILDGKDGQTALHLTTGTSKFLSQNVIIPNRVSNTCDELKQSLTLYQKPCQVIHGEVYDTLQDQINIGRLFSLSYMDWCGMADEKTMNLLFEKGLQSNAIVAFTASYRNWKNHMKSSMKKSNVATNTFLIAIKEWFQQIVEKHGYTIRHFDMALNTEGSVGFWLTHVTH